MTPSIARRLSTENLTSESTSSNNKGEGASSKSTLNKERSPSDSQTTSENNSWSKSSAWKDFENRLLAAENLIKESKLKNLSLANIMENDNKYKSAPKETVVARTSTPERSLLSKLFRSSGSKENSEVKDKPPKPKERRISRFLRPDFFDTPREESQYIKDKEAKKAEENERRKSRFIRKKNERIETAQNVSTPEEKKPSPPKEVCRKAPSPIKAKSSDKVNKLCNDKATKNNDNKTIKKGKEVKKTSPEKSEGGGLLSKKRLMISKSDVNVKKNSSPEKVVAKKIAEPPKNPTEKRTVRSLVSRVSSPLTSKSASKIPTSEDAQRKDKKLLLKPKENSIVEREAEDGTKKKKKIVRVVKKIVKKSSSDPEKKSESKDSKSEKSTSDSPSKLVDDLQDCQLNNGDSKGSSSSTDSSIKDAAPSSSFTTDNTAPISSSSLLDNHAESKLRKEHLLEPKGSNGIDVSPVEERSLGSFDSWSTCSTDTNRMRHDLPSPSSPTPYYQPYIPSDSAESIIDRIKRRSFYSRFNERKKSNPLASSMTAPSSSKTLPRKFAYTSRPSTSNTLAASPVTSVTTPNLSLRTSRSRSLLSDEPLDFYRHYRTIPRRYSSASTTETKTPEYYEELLTPSSYLSSSCRKSSSLLPSDYHIRHDNGYDDFDLPSLKIDGRRTYSDRVSSRNSIDDLDEAVEDL